VALKMRPTGLSSGFYKDTVDYSVFCGAVHRRFPRARRGRRQRHNREIVRWNESFVFWLETTAARHARHSSPPSPASAGLFLLAARGDTRSATR
jgi:hypothetical protein